MSNKKAEFAVKILLEYAKSNGEIQPRSTSDISPLEEFLIMKLFDATNRVDCLKSEDSELITIIEHACLKHHDSGESSLSREARLIIQALNDNGFEIKKTTKTKEVEHPTKTKEKAFLEIIKDLTFDEKIKIWSKYGKNYFYQDEKNGYLWCSYSLVWSIFESGFGMEYEQIQAFIKDMVDEHLKIKGLTPPQILIARAVMVDEHLKIKGLTPNTFDILK